MSLVSLIHKQKKPMITKRSPGLRAPCAGLLLLLPAVAFGQDSGAETPWFEPPLSHGPYLSLLAGYELPSGKELLANGFGGVIAAGYRQHFFSLEARGFYSAFAVSGGSAANDGEVHRQGGGVYAMLFPFSIRDAKAERATATRAGQLLSDAYLIAGAAGSKESNYPAAQGPSSFGLTSIGGGIGDLIQIRIFGYTFALRGEALYSVDHREKELVPSNGILGPPTEGGIPADFHEWQFNVGVQLPLLFTHQSSAMPDAPVRVVPLSGPPSGQDNSNPADASGCPGSTASNADGGKRCDPSTPDAVAPAKPG